MTAPNTTGVQAKAWTDYTHSAYDENAPLWAFAWDHYTGDILKPGKIELYLPRRAVGESMTAYRERVAMADSKPMFPLIVDSLAGMLFHVEGDANRDWHDEDTGKGLGDPEKTGTISNRLIRDADGMGTGWGTIYKSLAIELGVCHTAWQAVALMGTGPTARAVVVSYPALSVVNWIDDPTTGALTSVLVREEVDTRTSIRDEPTKTNEYKLFELDGWSTWRKDRNTKQPVMIDSGRYAYVDRYGNPTLPIYPVSLPMQRNVGYSLAKSANAMFNQASHLDHLLRTAMFPRLNVVANDEEYDKILDGLADGDNSLQNNPEHKAGLHAFISPSTDPAKVTSEILKEKIQEFFVSGFREYGNAARMKTATQSKQDVASGVGAFLQLLKTAIDEAENTALYLVAQTELKATPECWDIAHVERSDDFAPMDIQQSMDALAGKAFGGTDKRIPMGTTARIDAAKQAAAWMGLTVVDEEVALDVMIQDVREALDLSKDLPMPAEAKAQMVVKLLQSAGVCAMDGVELELLDPTKILAAALKLGQALDDDRILLSQQLATPPYPDTGNPSGQSFDPANPLPGQAGAGKPGAAKPGAAPAAGGASSQTTAPAFAVGDRVKALVDHMAGMKGMAGSIAEVHAGAPPYYAINFDTPMGEGNPHKWLAENEIAAADQAAPASAKSGKMTMK
jgi:hypothetical protein